MIDFSDDVLYDRVRYAGMAELADAQDLGSCEEIRMGSTPITRTKTVLPKNADKNHRMRMR